MSTGDTKTLIETGVRRFIEEVPALHQLKLVIGLELRGRGDVQFYRVEVPGPKVSKDMASDAKLRLSVTRSHFNELATEGHVKHWREAFEKGDAAAQGAEPIQKLIRQVVERHEERARTPKTRS